MPKSKKKQLQAATNKFMKNEKGLYTRCVNKLYIMAAKLKAFRYE